MWCSKCFYGNDYYEPTGNCPQCGTDHFVTKRPFPTEPEGMGCGKENGKTLRRRSKRNELAKI